MSKGMSKKAVSKKPPKTPANKRKVLVVYGTIQVQIVLPEGSWTKEEALTAFRDGELEGCLRYTSEGPAHEEGCCLKDEDEDLIGV